MNKSIVDAINESVMLQNNGSLIINESDFLSPGYIVVIAALIKKYNLPKSNIQINNNNIFGYLNTMGFYKELWGDASNYCRINEGFNYSPLVLLENEDCSNIATSTISNCISNLTDKAKTQGIDELVEVVGELHDNIWSHGRSTGFSMAQKFYYKRNKSDSIEFAVCDCGGGFLEEVNRSGIMGITTHAEAIKWCIKKGNSSKKFIYQKANSWEQSLPQDIINNPMKGIAKFHSENNHEGLGLYKLMNLSKKFHGELYIASGDAILSKKSYQDTIEFLNLNCVFKGVAISCKFNVLNLKEQDVYEYEELCDILKELVD